MPNKPRSAQFSAKLTAIWLQTVSRFNSKLREISEKVFSSGLSILEILVSILPTFYKQLFLTRVFCSFSVLTVMVCKVWRKDVGEIDTWRCIFTKYQRYSEAQLIAND